MLSASGVAVCTICDGGEACGTVGWLRTDYNSLQQNYGYLKEKYSSSLAELDIVRILTLGFGIVIVILAAKTLYFRKKPPASCSAKVLKQNPMISNSVSNGHLALQLHIFTVWNLDS